MKFATEPDAAAALLASPFIRRIAADERSGAETTVYYDTPRYRLKKLGLLLRVRQANGHFEQTVKHFTAAPDNILVRNKSSVPVAGPGPDADATSVLLGRLGGQIRCSDLCPAFATRIQCRRVLVKWAGAMIEISHHHGAYTSGTSDQPLAPISEIELELKEGTPEDLLRLAIAINERTTWRQIGAPKAERGFAAISQRLKPRFRKARPVPISDRMKTGYALQRIMAESLAQYFANDPSEISPQPEAIHQARVAIRRLRAALRAFKAVLPYGERKAFNSEFRWLQQALGKSRDWHVFQTETLPAIPGLEDHERTSLQSLAAARQSKYVKSGIEAMASRRATRLLLNFQLWLQLVEHHNPRFRRPVAKLAGKLLRQSYRRLVAAGRLDARRHIEELHAIRISGKKLRYALEFFMDTETARPFTPALPGLKALQKHLGNANDAATALALIAHERPGTVSAQARRKIESWAAARTARCVASAQPGMRLIKRVFTR